MSAAASRSSTKGLLDLEDSIDYHIRYSLGKERRDLPPRDMFRAVALAVKDRLVDKMLQTQQRYDRADAKRLYYLSIEFLMGRSLGNNLRNLGIYDYCREMLRGMGVDLDDVEENEDDAALGNGGLGRLAACFLDSLATLGMPGYGVGINYEYGLFKQEMDDGYQRERPDNWLAYGTPWEIERPDEAHIIPIYGRIEHSVDRDGQYNPMWLDWRVLIGVPYDMPIVGYLGETVNFLRLYSARSSHDFDIQIFNAGDYFRAVEQKMSSETISKVLYPPDSIVAGQELRLLQEYFLVACAMRDIVTRYLKNHTTLDQFPSKVAIQLNDTHPALAVAELMRILVDERDLPWETAWNITQSTFGYTNHTLLPESLEKWPVALVEYVVPRHLQIIFEINQRFLGHVASVCGKDDERARRMSIIDEGPPKQVRMAHLAIVGSHSTNGVAELHSELIRTRLVPDLYKLMPGRFNNKTNGITQRRWLLKANPSLAGLISATIGDGWLTDLHRLKDLESYAEDEGFRYEFRKIKRANKDILARIIKQTTRIAVDVDSLFDVQVKRIHEYKRQLLNVMNIIHQYFCLTEGNSEFVVPRTYVFAGKAAPGYWAAKNIIKLISSVGRLVNQNPRVRGLLKVVFIPDYRVSLAEKIIPAADLSEQISTAGMEASGTGNMKFALNGALTIGTLDGANIEIMQEVGRDNIFIFGLTADEVQTMRERHSYSPWDYYRTDPRVRQVMDSFKSDLFSPDEPDLFAWIYERIMGGGDEYFHLADLPCYINAQVMAGQEFQQPVSWSRKALLNVALIGKFLKRSDD